MLYYVKLVSFDFYHYLSTLLGICFTIGYFDKLGIVIALEEVCAGIYMVGTWIYLTKIWLVHA
jgi:hypothetical protein